MIRAWLTASRAQYSSTIVLPGIVGGVVAWYDGFFSWPLFLVTLVALFFANIGTNFNNDYYDYKSGVDAIDKGRSFKRGSEVLLKNGLSPKLVLLSAMLSLTITTAIGLYLVAAVDWRIIFFGLLGVFITYFYTAPPFKLGYRGLGELACWVGCGPLPVIGTYFVMTGRIGASAAVISIPVGLLVTAILYIGNVPDAEADSRVGKRTTSVRLGRHTVGVLGPVFYVATYLSVILAAATGVLPLWTLLSLLTVPLAVKLLRLTRTHYNDIPSYAPAIMMTVQVFSSTTLLLIAGLVVGHLA
ncbi:MAG: prenyltransferase [Chloroflexi bacterium]|nr:prenyltransferase [Chloroflexota bacterium]